MNKNKKTLSFLLILQAYEFCKLTFEMKLDWLLYPMFNRQSLLNTFQMIENECLWFIRKSMASATQIAPR